MSGRRPSYEELAAENAQLRVMVATLQATVETLQAEVAELRRQLGQDSRNSSRPPSSDSPFDKPAPTPKSQRKKSGKRPGGQPGHPGSTLEQVADPDTVVRHEPDVCAGCGAGLAGAPQVGAERRQVFDLPPIMVRVIEHQLVTRRCGCGAATCGAAPDGVMAAVQYGPRILGIIVYLYVGQFLSKQRTADALGELFGTPVSAGTVASAARRAASELDEFCTQIKDRIAAEPVAGFDETGLRVASKLHWVHCARTSAYTLITCHPKRGRAGIDDAGVLDRFGGIAVHDAWAPYDTYTGIEHQLCCAHALRELAAVADTAPADSDWCWADQVSEALVTMQNLVADAVTAGDQHLDPDTLAEQIHLYRSAAQIGLNTTADRTDAIMQKHHALARRLLDRQHDYLRFTGNWRIPADDNGSERDIRMIKLRQKVSGCLRTLTAAQQFCAIRSYLSTAAKHGQHTLDVLVMLAKGQPWLPEPQ